MTDKYTEEKTVDDLLGNPFDMDASLLPQEMENTLSDSKAAVKLIDRLTPEEQDKAKQLASQIPVGNYESIISYGANAQNELSRFSHKMLDHVQSNDIGPVGDVLNQLMSKLSEIDPDDLSDKKKSGLSRLFNKATRPVQEILTRYQKLGTQIDKISVQLEHSKKGLMDDVRMLDNLYEQNKTYFQALNVYIAAAELKVEEINNTIIPELHKKAQEANDQMMVQEVNDMAQFVDRLEKRLYDLQLSRQITIQSAPQIRMIQQTNQTLAEKIQASIMTAIPLWKNQIAIALTLNRQQKAVESQKLVTKTTNDLLLRNSEMLKVNSIETAKENEKGIIEIDTLKKTQENLIQTIEETLVIQADGRAKRREAEQEIARMEEDLKTRLLSVYEESKNRPS
ncbi:toxic anion resistance protein [Sporosarcina sp. P37]|uniref:toxic anion resistance protein n=1 Tax=unclassified Sporosarcina TaxID=2647733 RepID=UPI0009BCBEE7|nr:MULTISPECIES: toxic anion resistance protein [unclassified Sporosarcina]ARD46933.1 tellurite resistance protein TelA [Sporosarcina sp. P33]ARK23458.1 toxic anion resistance protein [Sporosarcina sp. P37]PID18669.1 toxic anion resistance protein [Sporosarcina sp. P35]